MEAEPRHDGQDPRRLFQQRLLSWGRANRRTFPWREEKDPFRVLVAEVLLQRSRAKTVAVVYRELFRRWPSAALLASASLNQIEDVIRPLGLVRRAYRLRALACDIAERGGVPESLVELEQLPGVGRYAARAALATTLGGTDPAVDAVTARVYRRFFGLEADADPSVDVALWDVVAAVVPRRNASELNWAALDLAASVCMPRNPRCRECPLNPGCSWAGDHA